MVSRSSPRINPLEREDDLAVSIVVPRSALTVVAAPPELLSQRNVEAVCGIAPRGFLDALPAFRRAGGSVTKFGKLRLVNRLAFVAWLAGRSVPRVVVPPPAAEDGADGVLRELGRRRVAAGVRR